MAALELRTAPASTLDFAGVPHAQPDLGPKWMPRFVRIVGQIPLTGSNKVRKAPLRQQWSSADPYWERRDRSSAYSRMTPGDVAALRAEFAANGRDGLLSG